MLYKILDNLQEFNRYAILKKGIYLFLVNYFDLKEEKQNLKEYFTLMDIDKDGELSFEELVSAYKFKVGSK